MTDALEAHSDRRLGRSGRRLVGMGKEVQMKPNLGMIALLALTSLSACTTLQATQSAEADRALCRQATEQARRGDVNWSATLGRMTSLIELQHCRDDINAYVFGSVNGGRD